MCKRIIFLILCLVSGGLCQTLPFDLPAKGPYFPFDERIIEDRWQVERFVLPLEKHPQNPLITKEYIWEGTGPYLQGTVLYDQDYHLYRMWYLVWNEYAYRNKLRFSYNICYAESDDGLVWRKPMLKVFKHQGNFDNNLIKLGRNKTQGIDVEYNPKSTSTGEKFIAIHNDSGGVFVSYSEDGKTFDCSFKKPAVPYHSDTHNNFIYDEIRNRWLMYVRPKAYAGAGLKHVGRRRVAVKESKDLINWSDEYTVLVPVEGDPDYFYGMTVFRLGDVLFGALQLYETVYHHIDCELVWSSDGYDWQRLPGNSNKLFLYRGAKGSWDAGMVFLADKPVIIGDEMRFYYGANNTPHDTIGTPSIGLATTKLNRLIGVRSINGQKSRLLTRPFKVNGDLVINARALGEIRIQVTDERDNAIVGYTVEDSTPFVGDQLKAKIKWGERCLSDLRGTIVRLRFMLEDAELYSFDFE